jgi:metallophosphoesterase (TIGR00282 family)
VKVLAIGDVIGRPGRLALARFIPRVRKEYGVDIVIANGENSAGGIGITPSGLEELRATGVDVVTSGNHVWRHRDIVPYLEDVHYPIVRPLNYPPAAPGKGSCVYGGLLVVNLIGRTFMSSYDCPFRAMDALLESVPDDVRAVLVDFHAEATSEKLALGRYLDGRVAAVVGTHTHVGTIDASVLPGGTAYVTDIGMAGPVESVIGDEYEGVIRRFLTMIPERIEVAKRGPVGVDAVLVEIDDATGLATAIERLREVVP